MAMDFTLEEMQELTPQITVFGVGGAGGNAVNNMIVEGLTGVSFVVANTDSQALAQSQAKARIQIGRAITQGLGAGARPEIGRAAAEESLPEIVEHLQGSHMCFIAAGMGGGTGTGAAPVIARAAKELDILTVGVVTKPFQFEGVHRSKLALQGIEELQQYVDTLIVIPNQNLFRIATERTTFSQAFELADQVLHSGVRGVTDLILKPGLINLDFADVRSVMSEMGKAMMGTGEAEGEHRAIHAAEAAISNPLLDDVSLKGARAVLINITGGDDMTLFDVDEASNRIKSDADPEANIIFGAVFDQSMNGKVRVSVVATGIENARAMQIPSMQETIPVTSTISQPVKPQEQREPVVAKKVEPVQAVSGMGNVLWNKTKVETVPAQKIVASATPVPEHNYASQTDSPKVPTQVQTDIVGEIARTRENSFTPPQTRDIPTSYAAEVSPTPQVPQSNNAAAQQTQSANPFKGILGRMSGKTTPNTIVADAGQKVGQVEDEDNFQIPAFLRRQIS